MLSSQPESLEIKVKGTNVIRPTLSGLSPVLFGIICLHKVLITMV